MHNNLFSKIFITFCFILLPNMVLSSCLHLSDDYSFSLSVEKDQYGNYHVDSNQLPTGDELEKQVLAFKRDYSGSALYINQDPSFGIKHDRLLKLGFDFAEYDYKKQKVLWILDNDRGVTHIGSGVSGAGVIVRNEKSEILLILNPDINTWVLPSGGTDRGELLRDGAIRELEEEVGLKANVDDLKVIAISNATNAMGRKGLNSINFFYLLEHFSGIARTSKEAPQILWINPNDLRGKNEHLGYKVHPFAPIFIEILNKSENNAYQIDRKGKTDIYRIN